MSANEYGLDASYMKGKLKIFLRDIDRHTPDEAARVLARLSMVADEKVLREPEFNERDTYRELCAEIANDIDYAILAINNDFGGVELLIETKKKIEKLLKFQSNL